MSNNLEIIITNNVDFANVVKGLQFRYAKTYTNTTPHEYCFAKDSETLEKVRYLNKYIQDNAEQENFYGKMFDVLFVDGYKYWSMESWATTDILNRNWDYKNEDGTINKSITEGYKGT